MALKPGIRYPAQTDVAAAYPHGKARNAGSYQDGTGTPFEKDWVNDLFGFEQALLDAATIVPSGNPDQVGASQYVDAVIAIAERNIHRQQALKGWHSVRPAATPASLLNIGAVRDPTRALALVCTGGVNGTLRVRSDGLADVGGDIATPQVRSMARDPVTGTIVAGVATGATSWAFRSTNQGTTWVGATTKPAQSAYQVVWGNGTFLARSSSSNLHTSPTGDVWTSRAIGILPFSIAATRTGVTEYLLVANQNSVLVSSDSGVTWAAGGVLPDAALHAVAGDGCMSSTPVGTEVLPFFLASISGGTAYRLYRGAVNGTGWTYVSTLPVPSDLTGINSLRLLGDVDTGALLAILVSTGTTKGTYLFLSLDAGASWLGSANVDAAGDAVAMAAGRIFICNARGIAMSNYEVPLL